MSVLLNASAAGRWGSPQGCPGSAVMESRHPEVDSSDIAREGKTAHDLADQILSGALTDEGLLALQDAPHRKTKIVIDEVMIAGVQNYVDYVREAVATMQPDADAYSEHFTSALRLNPAISGTTDYGILSPRKVHIIDFKFGFDAIEAVGNYQLITYLAGFMDNHLSGTDIQFDELEVELTIVQPRAPHQSGPIRSWRPDWYDIKTYFNQLTRAAAIAVGPSPFLRTGDHCRYCSAKLHCAPAIRAGVSLFELTGMVAPLNPTPQYLSALYGIVKRAQDQIKYLKDGLDAELKHRIQQGENIPGYALDSHLGHRKWIDETTVKRIAQVDEKDEWLRPVTPAQAARRGMDDDTLASLTDRKRTKPRVVRKSLEQVARIFN